MQTLTLTYGPMQVRLKPELGAAIEQFLWRDIDIFRPTPPGAMARDMGYFPLTPYPNRIGHGQLPGHAPLRLNFLPQPHSLHGVGWMRPWQVVQHHAHGAQLRLVHGRDDDWPFDCETVCDIELSTHTLQMRLTLRNTDTRPMPAGLGFHPFFPMDASTRLHTQWGGMWHTENWLPVQHGAPPPKAMALAAGQLAIADWQVDNCFTGWGGSALLDYPSHRVSLTAGQETPFLQFFQPGDGRPFFALEPVSHIPNAHQLAAQGNPSTGLRELAPGASLSISMAIRVEAPMLLAT